jgi:ABC-type multidrug transport system fused ATPase/permease subunit
MGKNFKESTVLKCFRLLPEKDHKKIFLVVILQISLGFLDLVGVALLGVLGSMTISGISSDAPGNRVAAVLRFFHVENLVLQKQVLVLGLCACFVLVLRTILSIWVTKKTLFFLSNRAAFLSETLIAKLLTRPLLSIRERTIQETLFSLTVGVQLLMLGVLGITISLIADLSLLIILSVALFIVDPVMMMNTFIVFSTIGVGLYFSLHKKARKLGVESSRLNIASNEKIVEVMNSYRELVVRNRRAYYTRRIGELRYSLAKTQAEIAFLPNISKYAIEIAVVFGVLVISGIQFLLLDASRAVGTLSIFLAATSRIAPAVLRAQQGLVTIKGNEGSANESLSLINSLSQVVTPNRTVGAYSESYPGFVPKVIMANTNFKYPNSDKFAVEHFSLEIEPGQFVAIVGSSGAGKTTLVDLLLDIITPTSGSISISGLTPTECISTYAGAIAYVPQDAMISNGTFRENVALGFPLDEATDERVMRSLKTAHLYDFVNSLPEGMDSNVGENGSRLSGGQRQRLGIARALFTNPMMLIMDEATSSLDGETEAAISESINSLRGQVTVISIAHRLSTIRTADQVCFMESGKLIAKGTFSEVRSTVPDFDLQAKRMGL